MELTDAQIETARATFVNDLTAQEQIRLVREVLETREDLFRRAYPQIVALGYGRHRDADAGNAPCLTFEVEAGAAAEAPPTMVFAYATVSGVRRLCAIAAEVEVRVQDEAYELHASDPVRIALDTAGTGLLADGIATCAFTRSIFGDRIFGLSCRHVLSPEAERSERPGTPGLKISLRTNTNRPIATTLLAAGPMLPSPATSLDAQLMEVTDPAGFADALGNLDIVDAVRDDDELDTLLAQAGDRNFWIHAPRGPVAVRYYKTMRGATLGGLRHRVMIRWTAADPDTVTEKGDSGAPVTTERTGGLLIGAHQGVFSEPGSDRWIGATIPAVDLLDPVRYGEPAADAWTLLNPDEVRSLAVPAAEVAGVPPEAPATRDTAAWLPPLLTDHGFPDAAPKSVLWRLAKDGIRINGTPAVGTPGKPKTVESVWNRFGDDIRAWAVEYDVPVELIIATICTESHGRPDAVRTEPGYRSDEETPSRVSLGLMQTLISTARETLGRRGIGDTSRIDRAWLLSPRNSIRAGTSYIREQFERPGTRSTKFDPPKVASAYNAGSLLPNDGPDNRWKMKQHPIGSGAHVDRFVEWFNDCFRLFEAEPAVRPSAWSGPIPSLFDQMRARR